MKINAGAVFSVAHKGLVGGSLLIKYVGEMILNHQQNFPG